MENFRALCTGEKGKAKTKGELNLLLLGTLCFGMQPQPPAKICAEMIAASWNPCFRPRHHIRRVTSVMPLPLCICIFAVMHACVLFGLVFSSRMAMPQWMFLVLAYVYRILE